MRDTILDHNPKVARPAPPLPPPLSQLLDYIIPWATVNKPDAAKATLTVTNHPAKARAYIARLIELRWDMDRDGRPQMPLVILHESSITTTMQRGGETFVVTGRYAPRPHRWYFSELTATPEEFDHLLAWKTSLDFYHT